MRQILAETPFFGARVRCVDEDSISERTLKLRREIELIREEERNYRGRKVHSYAGKTAHIQREMRLLRIRAELEALRKQRNRQ